MERKAWLEWRREGIGSSDASAILGIDPWKTKYDLYCDKVFGQAEDIDNFAMARGRALEPRVRGLLEDLYETLLEPRNVESQDIFRASLDAINFAGDLLFEIKCPGEKTHSIAKEGKVPEYYMAQLQHQLMVTGLPSVVYVSYMDDDLVEVLVNRNEEYIAHLRKEELAFWKMVMDKTPPQKEDRDYEEQESEDWQEVAKLYSESREAREALEKVEEHARERLINMAGGRNSKGAGLKVTKSVEDGRIDYKAAYEELKSMIPKEDLILCHDFESFRKNPIMKYRITVT